MSQSIRKDNNILDDESLYATIDHRGIKALIDLVTQYLHLFSWDMKNIDLYKKKKKTKGNICFLCFHIFRRYFCANIHQEYSMSNAIFISISASRPICCVHLTALRPGQSIFIPTKAVAQSTCCIHLFMHTVIRNGISQHFINILFSYTFS